MAEQAILDLGDLGLDRGGHLLVRRALRGLPAGGALAIHGRAEGLAMQLGAFCRAEGHEIRRGEAPANSASPFIAVVVRGESDTARRRNAERAGGADPSLVADSPSPTWGLAARGALVEAGVPAFDFGLRDKHVVWADEAARLYAQAAAAQWDPATAIPWGAAFSIPDEIEDAVVQVMTYLIENETAALIVPARFVARLHPHFREVMQLLAIQAADEARHIEVFTRRALLRRTELGLSTVGGQLSLKTLIDEPDFALAGFLLSVLGEGSFLSLLWFLHEHAPDPVTREVARLSAQDEARHVAFGIAHLGHHLDHDPGLRSRLATAVEARHAALQHSSGLNEEVFDALVILAAGSFDTEAIQRGYRAVIALKGDMDEGRQKRLRRLGFGDEEAGALSSLHTRNFM
jgi:hypothetical protein